MEFSLVGSILLSTILMYSSISKIVSYSAFKTTLEQLRFPSFFTWLVISVEVLISILLVIDSTRQLGLIASFLLFFSFVVVAGLTIYKKLSISCNCFGKSSEEKLGWNTIWKATPFLLISAIGIITDNDSSLLAMGATEILGGIGASIGLLNLYLILKNRSLFKGDITL